MVEVVWGRLLQGKRRRRRYRRRRSPAFMRIVGALRWATALAALLLLGWGVTAEIRTSYLQSRIFSAWAGKMSFAVGPGPSRTIIFPEGGPYDERLGYAELPRFISALGADHFRIARQARWSPTLDRLVKDGGYAIYQEKSQAGLQLFDRDGVLLYRGRYPERAYGDFASIPPLVVDSLLFIEDRDLLAPAIRSAIRRSIGIVSCSPPRAASPAWSTGAGAKAGQARWPPRPRSFSIRRAGAPRISPRNCAR